MPDITHKEEMILDRNNIEFRIVEDFSKGFLLTIFRYINSPLTFEIEFNPALYNDDDRSKLFFDNRFMNIVAVDTQNKSLIIKSLRTIILPDAIHKIWKSYWSMAKLFNKNYSEEYVAWVDNLRNTYDIHSLYIKAKYICKI